jgi:hypothetical protein
MNTQQTAVDWLIEQLTPSISLQQKHIDELKEKAKEMFEKQIEDAWYAGDEDGAIHEFEQYYKETYGPE